MSPEGSPDKGENLGAIGMRQSTQHKSLRTPKLLQEFWLQFDFLGNQKI